MVPAVLTGEDRGAQADRLVAALHDPPPDLEPPADPEPMPDPDPPPHPEVVADPDPTPDPVPPPTPAPDPPRRSRRETIRLRVERLDELVRLVGEASAAALRVGRLVTDQLGVEPAGIPELHDLSRVLESLQERTLQARMVPFGTIAEPLRRAARNLARSLGKAVELELRGQETELDRACSSGSPTRCSTWSATPSTTASRHRSAGWPPASPARARSRSTRPSSAPRSW